MKKELDNLLESFKNNLEEIKKDLIEYHQFIANTFE